jgi:hypothetical protein
MLLMACIKGTEMPAWDFSLERPMVILTGVMSRKQHRWMLTWGELKSAEQMREGYGKGRR